MTPLVIGLAGLLLVVLQGTTLEHEPFVLALFVLAALALTPLAVSLPGVAAPIRLQSLVLVPVWLLWGSQAAAALASAAALFAWLARAPARLPVGWQLSAGLAGIGLGGALGNLAGLLIPDGLVQDVVQALCFASGLWGGQAAVEWLSPRRGLLLSSWPITGLTVLVLLPPGFFLAEIGARGDLVPFAISLGLALGLVILIRTSTNSETRTAELEAQAVSSANARHRLELIVDHAPEALLGLDRAGRVLWLNRTAAEWLGDRAAEAVGRLADQVVPLKTAGGVEIKHSQMLGQAARSGHPLHEETLFEGAPGAPERVLASYSLVKDPVAGELGMVLLRDASLVGETVREQEELVVHLSHELRAPLTTILGYAQLMTNPTTGSLIPGAQTVFAKRISESGDYMLQLVNNLLDLGRLTRDDTPGLPLAQVDVAELNRQLIDANRPQAAEKAQTLLLEQPPGSVALRSNDLALRQILTNLIANAIKYTPPNGEVRVVLTASPTEVVWKIVDNGIGLSPEEQERLFTKFFRSQRAEARLIKGTGLGLALTRTLVERLGGTIEVESAVDQGSTFTVRLPRAA